MMRSPSSILRRTARGGGVEDVADHPAPPAVELSSPTEAAEHPLLLRHRRWKTSPSSSGAAVVCVTDEGDAEVTLTALGRALGLLELEGEKAELEEEEASTPFREEDAPSPSLPSAVLVGGRATGCARSDPLSSDGSLASLSRALFDSAVAEGEDDEDYSRSPSPRHRRPLRFVEQPAANDETPEKLLPSRLSCGGVGLPRWGEACLACPDGEEAEAAGASWFHAWTLAAALDSSFAPPGADRDLLRSVGSDDDSGEVATPPQRRWDHRHRVHRRRKLDRLADLRRNLQPFDPVSARPPAVPIIPQQRSRSLQELTLTARRPLVSRPRPGGFLGGGDDDHTCSDRATRFRLGHPRRPSRHPTTALERAWNLHCGGVMHCGPWPEDDNECELGQSTPAKRRPTTSRASAADVDDACSCCYDSDPEPFGGEAPPSKPANKPWMGFDDDSNKENVPPNSARPGKGFVPPPPIPSIEVPLGELVEELWNGTFTWVLHWHVRHESAPPMASALGDGSVVPSRPQAVRAWVERGQRLSTILVPPKLAWRPACHRPTSTQHPKKPSALLLLDIHRILEADLAAPPAGAFRHHHRPLPSVAKPSHSFYVATLEQSCLFEVATWEQRQRVVRGLKALVSRLGSLLHVRDGRLWDEFFVQAGENGVGASCIDVEDDEDLCPLYES